MRIVAGSAGGIPLFIPDGPVRPTMDRVREAVFSSLGDLVPGARVLDLFAGSGALGLEALSRGATSLCLVDQSPKCTEIIRKNLKKCHLEASVQTMDAFQFVEKFTDPDSFDLIFADPPYKRKQEDRDWAADLLSFEPLSKSLGENGFLILETGKTWKLPERIGWQIHREKRYGDSRVWILSPLPASAP